jgi:hypothetical protein
MCLGGTIYLCGEVFSRVQCIVSVKRVFRNVHSKAYATMTEHWQHRKRGFRAGILANVGRPSRKHGRRALHAFPTCHEKASSRVPRMWPMHGPLPLKAKGQARDLRQLSIRRCNSNIIITDRQNDKATKLYLLPQLPVWLGG